MGSDDKLETLAKLFQGRFEIREKLSWNGLALVYGAKGLMHRDLAVAVLPLDCDSDPAHSRLFHRTFERLKAQHDLPTPAVEDLGIQRGVPFVAFEREEGVLLAEMLDGPLPVPAALEMTDQLLEALAAVHAFGLHHGDLTPHNVLVQPTGIRLLGLGIAPLLRRMGPDVTGPTGRGSGPKARRYLAPEILQNRLTGDDAPGPASDIYAVGALLHRLLTGRPPGEALDAGAEERLSEHPTLATVIERAMSEAPKDRPSIETLRAMLAEDGPGEASTLAPASEPIAEVEASREEAAGEEPPRDEVAAATPSDPPVPEPSTAAPAEPGGGKWVAALVVLIAAGVGGWWVLGRSDSADPEPPENASSVSTSDPGESDSEPTDPELGDSDPELGAPNPELGDSDPERGSTEAEPELGSTAAEPEPDPLDSLGASGPLVGLSEPFLVEELERISARGESYEQEDFRRIYGWIARHSGDVRGHLVLARAYVARGWHRAVVESYEEALGVDAEAAKSDPLILGHLIDAYVNGSEPVMAMAWPLLRRHWGPGAAAGLEPLEAQALRPALRRRVRSLRGRIERLED